jgi:hypothetical protein
MEIRGPTSWRPQACVAELLRAVHGAAHRASLTAGAERGGLGWRSAHRLLPGVVDKVELGGLRRKRTCRRLSAIWRWQAVSYRDCHPAKGVDRGPRGSQAEDTGLPCRSIRPRRCPSSSEDAVVVIRGTSRIRLLPPKPRDRRRGAQAR